MRILYVITPSRLSGAERQLLRTAVVQRGMGDDVLVLSKPLPAFEGAAAEAGVPVVTARIGGKLNLAAPRRIARQIRRSGADVVVTVHSTATFWGVRAAAATHTPCVAYMQAANTPWPYTTAPAAIGCAEFVRRHLIQAGMRAERVYAVPNGIDPAPFLADETRAGVRSELGLADKDIAVGTLAHFTPRKAHADLLKAAAQIVPKVPNLKLLWAGEGPLEGELRRMAADLGLREHVRFLGFRSDAARLHQAFDIFALASLLEGLPLSVLEAMASARPCVVTAVSGNPELVEDGVTGYLVPPRDPLALSSALLRLVGDAELRAAMGDAARRRIMEHFTLDRTAAMMRDVLQAEIRRQRQT
jgi:glycosyltransferase involved in cell wall biosynthesis